MAGSMTFRCCNISVTTIYQSDCGGGTSASCPITGNVYRLIINNVRSNECWEAVDGYYPEAITAIITYDASYEPYDSCNDCLQHNYKLYNCFDDTIIYTNYLECPNCINYINQMMYTNIEPNPCWYITVASLPIGPIIPVLELEGFCDPCDPSCYIITGIGVITYFNQYYELATADAPARVCASSYPSVSGINYTITQDGDCSYRNSCPTYCYELTNCITEEVIRSTNQDLAFPFVLNETIEIAERDGCWTITRALVEICTGVIETTIINTYANCEDCIPAFYYRLESCGNSEPIILYTSQDLSAYVGQTVSLNDYIGCYNVTIYQGQVPNPVTISFKNNYPDCIECALPRYKLIDCDGIRPSIYTTTDVSAYLSSVIKLTFYPDTCWTVETTTINSSDDLVIIDKEFTDCQECSIDYPCICSTVTNNSDFTQTFTYRDCDGNTEGNDIILAPGEVSIKHCVLKWIFPEFWTLPKIITEYGECVEGKCVVVLPFRSVRPGYNSPSCSVQYYERIACEYAEILYRDVIAQRYGIAPCCSEEELYRIDIKFQLLELQAINNLDYLCAQFNPCCHRDDSCGCGCNNNSCQQTTNCGCGCNS